MAKLSFAEKDGLANYVDLIEFVDDRPGHDLRYAIDTTQTSTEIGWEPLTGLKEGLDSTVKWYLNNKDWWQSIQDAKYDGKRLGLNRSPKNRGK